METIPPVDGSNLYYIHHHCCMFILPTKYGACSLLSCSIGFIRSIIFLSIIKKIHIYRQVFYFGYIIFCLLPLIRNHKCTIEWDSERGFTKTIAVLIDTDSDEMKCICLFYSLCTSNSLGNNFQSSFVRGEKNKHEKSTREGCWTNRIVRLQNICAHTALIIL